MIERKGGRLKLINGRELSNHSIQLNHLSVQNEFGLLMKNFKFLKMLFDSNFVLETVYELGVKSGGIEFNISVAVRDRMIHEWICVVLVILFESTL